jgi:hypothetical protein
MLLQVVVVIVAAVMMRVIQQQQPYKNHLQTNNIIVNIINHVESLFTMIQELGDTMYCCGRKTT